LASGALEEPRRDQPQRQTAGEEELRLSTGEAFRLIKKIFDLVRPQVAAQALGLLSSLVGVVGDLLLALFPELLAGLVRGMHDGVQAVDRPLLLHFKQCRSPFLGLVQHLACLILSLVDDRRRAGSHLINNLPDLLLHAAGVLSCLLLHGQSFRDLLLGLPFAFPLALGPRVPVLDPTSLVVAMMPPDRRPMPVSAY
jgi:hypothetical protein